MATRFARLIWIISGHEQGGLYRETAGRYTAECTGRAVNFAVGAAVPLLAPNTVSTAKRYAR